MKQKAFFIILEGISVVKNFLRPESRPFMGKMSLLIKKSQNCFRKTHAQVEKCVTATSKETQYKTFLKTLQIFNYNRLPGFH